MFLLLAFLASASASILNCNTGSVFTITKLAADPPGDVIAGQNITWILMYTSPSVVTGGTATSSITFNGIPFTPTVDDLCTKFICPLVSGAHDGSSWFVYPAGVNGKIIVRVSWKDMNNAELLCISYTVKSSKRIDL
jgi:hypothetical protein